MTTGHQPSATGCRRGSSSIAREVPEVIDKLRDLTRSQAQDRIREDKARRKNLQVPHNTRSVSIEARRAHEDAVADLTAVLVDPDQSEGNEWILLQALGLSEYVIDQVEDVGGPCTFAEMQRAVDQLSYEEIVAARDAMRRDFLQATRCLDSPLFAFFSAQFDDPAVVGVTLAMSVASGLAMVRRTPQSDVAEKDQSA